MDTLEYIFQFIEDNKQDFPNADKNYSIIIAKALGFTVQYYSEIKREWVDKDDNDFKFHSIGKFRIKPLEIPWFENIPEKGILCWVSDLPEPKKETIAIIVEKTEDGYYLEAGGDGDLFWNTAVPLTGEEVNQYIYKKEN